MFYNNAKKAKSSIKKEGEIKKIDFEFGGTV